MPWQPQISESVSLQAGDKVRVSFDFTGYLIGDVGSVITNGSDLRVTQVNRDMLQFIQSVEGVMINGSTIGSLRAQIKQVLDTWSTWNVIITGVDTYAIGISAPDTQTAVVFASIAIIAIVLLVAASTIKGEMRSI